MSETNMSSIVLNNPVKEFIWVFRHKDRLLPSSGGSEGTPALINNGNILNNTNPNDPFNYSLHEENINLGYGSFDTFKNLKIIISNKDRMNQIDATFFRTIQPYKHHSNIPGGSNNNEKQKYIYSYSFALNPEDYQPSGSYNFTKTNDTLKLEFTGIGNPSSETNDLTNYRIDLFSLHYKYISVFKGGIIYKDVPFSKKLTGSCISPDKNLISIENKIINRINNKTSKQLHTEDKVKEELNTQLKNNEPLNESLNEPNNKFPKIIIHKSVVKKKWSGLEGRVTRK